MTEFWHANLFKVFKNWGQKVEKDHSVCSFVILECKANVCEVLNQVTLNTLDQSPFVLIVSVLDVYWKLHRFEEFLSHLIKVRREQLLHNSICINDCVEHLLSNFLLNFIVLEVIEHDRNKVLKSIFNLIALNIMTYFTNGAGSLFQSLHIFYRMIEIWAKDTNIIFKSLFKSSAKSLNKHQCFIKNFFSILETFYWKLNKGLYCFCNFWIVQVLANSLND